jgi:hypothetical protein
LNNNKKTINMKNKIIAAFSILTFLMACNETANQSLNSADTTVTVDGKNKAVSPGTSNPAKSGVTDSSMNKTDSLARDKR